MELQQTFTVPVPVDRAWDALLDPQRIAAAAPTAARSLVTSPRDAWGAGVAAASAWVTPAASRMARRWSSEGARDRSGPMCRSRVAARPECTRLR